ncbi:hypothetical protein JR316_0011228 [Psilocybe cubensis]|uniref:Uncharacterized protein n=2 Tax=Psilocybe cubensis TaxID=181762 RepID=A0A8H7XTW8_PSICU|nr:hypothetical protein JR316_0011228 [Psilocybe cubensis]KAH9475669.1 hypothetical protein JR316_0011228 [Psilocybe cubensis]
MPKHVPVHHYDSNPYELVPKGIIHPDVEHHDHPEDAEHYLLPVVFALEEGAVAHIKYPGPGVYFFSQGEIEYEDTAKPGHHTLLKPGSVLHIEDGSVIRWRCKSPSGVKGFAAFYVPVSVKSLDEFVVPE